MGGREVAAIHTAKEEIEAYRKRIRELEAEEARLKTLFTALRARATSSLLGPSVASLAPLAEQLGAEPLAAAAQAEVILAQQQAMTAQSQAELSEWLRRLQGATTRLEERLGPGGSDSHREGGLSAIGHMLFRSSSHARLHAPPPRKEASRGARGDKGGGCFGCFAAAAKDVDAKAVDVKQVRQPPRTSATPTAMDRT